MPPVDPTDPDRWTQPPPPPPPPRFIRESPPPAQSSFRLNASSVAVLVTVVLQAAATISWGAKMDARLAAVEKAIAPIMDGTVARLDERTRNIEKGVERLEGAVSELHKR